MGKDQFVSLLLAVITVLFLLGISVSIGEGSIAGILLCILGAGATVAFGISLKRKRQKADENH